MSTPRASGPGQVPQRPGSDPAVEALLEYLATTAVTPPADLTARIQARIAREPDRTPPRRYVLALLHLRLRAAAGALRQVVGVAAGRGSFPTLLRVQALGLILVTVLAAAALGAGAAAGVTRLLEDRRPTPPTDTFRPDPTGAPTPRDTADPTPAPTAPDAVRVIDPTPRVADPTHAPSRTAQPPRTPRPQQGGSDPTHAPAVATPHPDKTPKAGHPEPTRTPHPTPRKTREPDKTPKPPKTPRPTRTPGPDRTPHPTDTPEPGDDDGGDDGGSGGDGGGGHGGDGPGETDKPDGHPDEAAVGSGDVWTSVLVLPASSQVAEGHA